MSITVAPPPPVNKNTVPANALWVELSTRITTQRLHYRSGDEETAAKSLYSLFALVRKLMTDHPEANDFQALAEPMLNQTIRSYTARWHGWMVPDPILKDKDGQPIAKFRDPQLRRLFRQELRQLQPYLLGYQKAFDLMRRGLTEKVADDNTIESIESLSQADAAMIAKLTKECCGSEKSADLGAPFPSGLLRQVWPEEGSTDNVKKKGIDGLVKIEKIEERERIRLNFRRDPSASAENKEPIENAIGLALSGGGIKSATFCLGVVQQLVQRGIFAQVDYLSTVSGGGYCGSFLSAFLGSVKEGGKPAATKADADKRACEALLPQVVTETTPAAANSTNAAKPGLGASAESKAVRHLRNHSKYILNGGTIGKLNIAGIIATGVLSNLLMLLPAPLFIALGLAALGKKWKFWGDADWWKDTASLLPEWSTWAGQLFMWPGIVLAAVWFLLPGVQRWTNHSKADSKGAYLRSIWEFGTLLLAVFTVLTGLIYAYPLAVKSYLTAGKWFHEHLETFAPTEKTMAAITGIIPMLLATGGFVFRTTWLKNLLLKAFVVSGPIFYAFIILYVSIRLGLGVAGQGPWGFKMVGGIATVWLLWSLYMVNLNTLSPHRYYRARLCETYLAVPSSPKLNWWGKMRARIWEGFVPGKEDVGTVQHLKLSSLGESRAAPYHLINAIINLPASKNRNLRGRDGDFFLMSREFCGSPVVGYVETARLEAADPCLDLGTAMAISAAAVNTNMGWRTAGLIGSFRFLMTLLNARLGYWLPNFRLSTRDKDKKLEPLKNRSVGAPYLLAEMGGRIQENMNHLNVSDGGHIENLGVYELLRRKCKFIISVDGGANRDVVGGDLQRLEGYAAIDFGIRMEYDLAELQPDAEGICKTAAILVKILYSDTDIGWMIYLRPGITGNEPAYVIDYWKQNTVFPYESILDQIFEEEQFEGYRCLGEMAVKSLFRKELGTESTQLKVADWFQSLATNLLPDNDAAFKAEKN